jgi:multidrug resistance efflux pump
VALLFWLSGVVGAAILARREWLVITRLRRSCLPIDRRDLRDATNDLACVLGLRSVPELRAGSVVARPMLVGVFRPAILLPVAMLRDPRSIVAIRPVLAHELAHVHRGDLLWSGLSGLVRALFFFHPLVWLAHREALLAREAACDALALRASGMRPSEYGRILLDIAAGGLERPSFWAVTLGMAGSAGSLKRRLMAMRTTQPPSRRRLLSWAFALLAIGAAGIIPWQLVPREAFAQNPPVARPATEPAREGNDERVTTVAELIQDRLKLAEGRLMVADAEQRIGEVLVKQAEAEAESAAAQRKYREKALTRMVHLENGGFSVFQRRDAPTPRQDSRKVQLEKRPAIEHALVEEEELALREAEAGERAAKARITVSHSSLEGARAAVREAEALRDIARAELRDAPDAGGPHRPPRPPALRADAENDWKEARARLHAARLGRARAERDAARAEIDRAEANLRKAKTAVEYRTKQFGRLKQLFERQAIEQRLLDEQEQALTEARGAEREAEAAVRLARARLEAAEARLKAVEAEGGAANRGPITPPPVAPR